MKNAHRRFAVPPGQYLIEELEARNIGFFEFKAHVPELTTEADLETGATVITSEMADAIAKALDMPVKVWLDLEESFRQALGERLPLLSDHSLEAAQAKAASGKLLLRLPASLHRRAAEAARAEGINLYQLLLSHIAEGIGRTEGNHSPTRRPGGWRDSA